MSARFSFLAFAVGRRVAPFCFWLAASTALACASVNLPAAPFRLEAEAARLDGVVIGPPPHPGEEPIAPESEPLQTPPEDFSGAGYVGGFNAGTDHVEWTFSAPAGAGFYRLTLGLRSPSGYKEFGGKLSDSRLAPTWISGRLPASTEFKPVLAALVELTDSPCTLRIGGGWGHYELDYAELTPVPRPAAPAAVTGGPSDPSATPATRALFARLTSSYGRTTFSGQQEIEDAVRIQQLAGRTPIILSGDLMDFSPTRREHGAKADGYSEAWIERHRQGHLISMMWHWNAPDHLVLTAEYPWWKGFSTGGSTFDVAAALADPAGSDHAKILRDIDAIAVELKKFADADVPLLWRPLHEAEGAWFWWGARGPEAYKKLWRLLHERLTRHHGLHNLIWVLTSEDPAWYPGDDVVDVIGVDAYPEETSDLLSARWLALLERFDGRKLIALTEFGGMPDIPRMQRLGVWWSWFAPWTGSVGSHKSPPEMTRTVYAHDAVVSLAAPPASSP
jgi:mannan endo-1,4-beta-mannosidase